MSLVRNRSKIPNISVVTRKIVGFQEKDVYISTFSRKSVNNCEFVMHERVDILFVSRRIDRKWFYSITLVPKVMKTPTTLKKGKPPKCSRRYRIT